MTEILREKDFFSTTDICLSATLRCFGYAIEAIDRTTPSRATFLIKRDGQLDELIQQYFSHYLKVEPVAFFNALKELKTRIYHV